MDFRGLITSDTGDDKFGIGSFIRNYQVYLNEESGVFLIGCEFEINKYKPVFFSQLGIKLPARIQKSVRKRQAEFLAGRYIVQLALKQIGASVSNVPIGIRGAPVWPAGVSGSISHSDSIAICAVSPSSNKNFIGVDVENIFTSETALNVAQIVASDEDLLFFEPSGLGFQQFLTLVFSAKESLFKAISCFLSEYLNFDSSKVIGILPEEKIIILQLRGCGSVALGHGSIFRVSYRFFDNYVMTFMVYKNAQT